MSSQQTVIGIDEVGRGCWAGPLLVVAARQRVALPAGLADSKRLSRQRRELLTSAIVASCDLGEGWVAPTEIDELGLTAAMRLGTQRALAAIHAQPNERIIMDGHINYCSPNYLNVSAVIKADALHPIVSAASIHAKVVRDNYMTHIALQYPGYGFEQHVGYGTAAHKLALEQRGVCDIHRRSYKPVRAFT